MAFIVNLEIPRHETLAIAGLLASEGATDVPELGEEGTKVLDAVTSLKNPNSLWSAIIGDFVEYRPTGTGWYQKPDEDYVQWADVLMGEDGQSTGRYGEVIPNNVDPEAVYIVGVPI